MDQTRPQARGRRKTLLLALFVSGALFFLATVCKMRTARRSIHETGSGACGSGGAHDGTDVLGPPKFLCYNFSAPQRVEIAYCEGSILGEMLL